MTNRDKELLERRLELSINDTSVSPEEVFQNKTLRPILKFQNDLIISWFDALIGKFRIELKENSEQVLHHYLSKNNTASTELKGIIIGHFTNEEFKTYFDHSKDLGKRIIQMSVRRYISQR